MAESLFERALQALQSRLGPAAFEHCIRVAATAQALAAVYGVSEEDALLAGLLHDWDRELSDAELVARAGDLGVDSSEADARSPYLLHARTGAAELTSVLPGLQPRILAAIERHTVGAPDMSDLDMVVWLADMLEPARSFDGVDDLRELVGTVPLGELFARGYQHSVEHLVSSRKAIHPDTVSVWNALVARRTS